MESAIELAGSGHLSISTLHANNSHQALDRIINMFPEEQQKLLLMDLAINLKAIVSPRLVRSTDGKRAAAVEVLINTPHISELIRDGRINELHEAMEQSSQKGMQTYDEALLKLHKEGRIELDEALKNADSSANLEAKINFG
jgi:twitching motility protein PilU